MRVYIVGDYVRHKLTKCINGDEDIFYVLEDENSDVINDDNVKYLISNGFRCYSVRNDDTTYSDNRLLVSNSNLLSIMEMDDIYASYELLIVKNIQTIVNYIPFTIYSLAMDLDGNIVDVCNAMRDIENKMVRTPIFAYNVLKECPLRVLIAIKIAVIYDMDIDPFLYEFMIDKDILSDLHNKYTRQQRMEILNEAFKHDVGKTLEWLSSLNDDLPDFIHDLL